MPGSERERLRKAQDFRSAQSAQSCQDRGKKSVGRNRLTCSRVAVWTGLGLNYGGRGGMESLLLSKRNKRAIGRLLLILAITAAATGRPRRGGRSEADGHKYRTIFQRSRSLVFLHLQEIRSVWAGPRRNDVIAEATEYFKSVLHFVCYHKKA